jgi:hypothetical protein
MRQPALCRNPEERIAQLHSVGSLKSRGIRRVRYDVFPIAEGKNKNTAVISVNIVNKHVMLTAAH